MNTNDQHNILLMQLRQTEVQARGTWNIIGSGILIGALGLFCFVHFLARGRSLESFIFLALFIAMIFLLIYGIKLRMTAQQKINGYKAQLAELDRLQATPPISNSAMFCKSCGKALVGAGQFCQSCGTKQ